MPWDQVECHPFIRKAIVRSIEKNMFTGTTLIYGFTGAGQASVARALAMTLNCQRLENDFCGECSNCKRILDRTFSDVFNLRPSEDWAKPERKGRDYGIDHMREVQKVAQIHPYEGEKRIFILNDAHCMTEEAANCLLKTLEEPSPHSLFILLTDNVNAMLPTILSRCRRIRLYPMETDTLAQKLCAEAGADIAETLARAAGGLPERARQMLKEGYLERRDEMLDLLLKVRQRSSAAIEESEPLAKDRVNLREKLVILMGLLRDGLVLTQTEDEAVLLNPDKREVLMQVWQGESPDNLIAGVEAIQDALERLDHNVNPTILMTELLQGLHAPIWDKGQFA